MNQNLHTRWRPSFKQRENLQVLTLIILLLSAIWMFNLHTNHASETLVVPQDYSTIGEAINHASAGDKILIQSGVYNEDIRIDKSLMMEGQDQSNTIILGKGDSTPTSVLTLAANEVKVSGLTIESISNSNKTKYAYGIWVEGDNCTITGNIIQNTYMGIFCSLNHQRPSPKTL